VVIALVAGAAIGYARGGSLARLGTLRPTRNRLLLTGVGLHVVGVLLGWIWEPAFAMFAGLSLVIWAFYAWVNRTIHGAALIAAGLAAKASFGVLKIENERDKERFRREDQAQADHVAAWLIYQNAGQLGGVGSPLVKTGFNFPGTWKVLVANRSNLPVYDVWVTICDEGGNVLGTSSGYHPVAGPGETVLPMPPYDGDGSGNADSDGDPVPSRDSSEIRVELHFSDTGGRNWTRSRRGHLKSGWDMDLMPPQPVFDDWGNRLDDGAE
jgi:hypothetical protein